MRIWNGECVTIFHRSRESHCISDKHSAWKSFAIEFFLFFLLFFLFSTYVNSCVNTLCLYIILIIMNGCTRLFIWYAVNCDRIIKFPFAIDFVGLEIKCRGHWSNEMRSEIVKKKNRNKRNTKSTYQWPFWNGCYEPIIFTNIEQSVDFSFFLNGLKECAHTHTHSNTCVLVEQ